MKGNVSLVSSSFLFVLASVAASAQEENESVPVEYVRVCDTYGEGYYYIPSGEICVNADTGVTKKETEEGTVVGQTALAARVKRLEEALNKLMQEK